MVVIQVISGFVIEFKWCLNDGIDEIRISVHFHTLNCYMHCDTMACDDTIYVSLLFFHIRSVSTVCLQLKWEINKQKWISYLGSHWLRAAHLQMSMIVCFMVKQFYTMFHRRQRLHFVPVFMLCIRFAFVLYWIGENKNQHAFWCFASVTFSFMVIQISHLCVISTWPKQTHMEQTTAQSSIEYANMKKALLHCRICTCIRLL